MSNRQGSGPPLRQQLLFPSAHANAPAPPPQRSPCHRRGEPSSPADQEALLLQRLWQLYCASLSQTHHRALTYTDPLVGEMWKLFAPLLRCAAILPLHPSHSVPNRDDADGNGGVGEEEERSSLLSESAVQILGSGRATSKNDGKHGPYRSAFEGSDEEKELNAENAMGDGADSETMPVTHVFCVHLQRNVPVRETDSSGRYGRAEEEEAAKSFFPTCTPEMNAALTEQPRIMLPLLEFLAAVMALQQYQQHQQRQRKAGSSAGCAQPASPLPHSLSHWHPDTSGTTSSNSNSGGSTSPFLSPFNPLKSRLYCCVVGDIARPTSFEHLGAAQLGRMITVRGTIIRMSPPRITCLTMAYKCGLCGAVKRQAAEDGLLVYPSTCDGGKCRGYKWAPMTEDSECEEVQILKIQEVTDFFVDVSGPPEGPPNGDSGGGGGGGMTKVMEVELRAPWLDHATVGDMVNITGVLSTRRGDRKAGGTQHICIRARSLVAARQGGSNGDLSGQGTSAPSRSAAMAALFAPLQQQQQQQQPLWSPEEAAKFYEMSRHQEWFTRLANSVAPALYGLRKEKEAVLLAMIGGSSAGSKIGARSNIHLLLVGDPGMGKSQLLRAACTVAPRSAFVCAHTSSSCGLTMTLARDPVSGETAFEAGAVVHGDGGITCIDELDKAAAEHKALLEVMEQESVSIAKAGMVFSMPVHTSVLAAGNPVGGRFDFSKPITRNLNLSPALLSRFDIVVCLRDAPQRKRPRSRGEDGGGGGGHNNTEDDGFFDNDDDDDDAYTASNLTSHVLELHRRGGAPHPRSSNQRGGTRRTTPTSSSGAAGSGVLPHSLVQDFIIFSRSQCQPTLSWEACDVLKHHYLSERAKRAAQVEGGGSSSSALGTTASTTAELHPVTPRYLQALIRVSEARAKVELRLEVSRDDAEYAVELLQSCLGSFSNGGAGSPLGVEPANMHGNARKKRNQQEQVVDLLKAEIAQNGGVNLLSHAAVLEACEAVGCRNANAMVHQLNEFGILLSAGGKYKLRGGGG